MEKPFGNMDIEWLFVYFLLTSPRPSATPLPQGEGILFISLFLLPVEEGAGG
jgi:hypothetical protein